MNCTPFSCSLLNGHSFRSLHLTSSSSNLQGLYSSFSLPPSLPPFFPPSLTPSLPPSFLPSLINPSLPPSLTPSPPLTSPPPSLPPSSLPPSLPSSSHPDHPTLTWFQLLNDLLLQGPTSPGGGHSCAPLLIHCIVRDLHQLPFGDRELEGVLR